MFTQRPVPAAALVTVVALLPTLAEAHAGHTHGSAVFAGLGHPLSGLDHLLAMLALGAWAAHKAGRRPLLLPALFLLSLTAGALLAGSWSPVPAVEFGIASSVVLLGLLLAFALRLSDAASFMLVAVFALFHGLAHGLESPQGQMPWAYVAGFTLSSALLLATGFTLARILTALHLQKALRFAGAGVACFGLLLMS